MLQETLHDQIKDMEARNENAKIELLRRISTASVLGVPIKLNTFINSLPKSINNNYQSIINELNGEFIELSEDRNILGLHNVRSQHLAVILHNKYLNIAATALNVFDCIPTKYISTFVYNALIYKGFDSESFIFDIQKKYFEKSIEVQYQILQGLFEGGEYLFLIRNKPIFDNAYRLGGGNNLIFSIQLAPVKPLDALSDLINILGDKSNNFQKMQELTHEIDHSIRGLSIVKSFLEKIHPQIIDIEKNIEKIGGLLDWFALCKLKLPYWDTILPILLNFEQFDDISLEDFCLFSQGFYKYDEANHKFWFENNRSDIIDFLLRKLGCISIEINENECNMLYINSDNLLDPHKATVNRLDFLRSAIPFCKYYNGNDMVLDAFNLDYNPSKKRISKKSVPFKSDIYKNNAMSEIIDNEYREKTWHEFQQKFYELRTDLIRLFRILTAQIEAQLSGKKFDFKAAKKGNEFVCFELLKYHPHVTPIKVNTQLELLFKDSKNCFQSINNFLTFLNRIETTDDKANNKRLLLLNFSDYNNKLPKMQLFFDTIQEITYSYFDFKALNNQESQVSKKFETVLNSLINLIK